MLLTPSSRRADRPPTVTMSCGRISSNSHSRQKLQSSCSRGGRGGRAAARRSSGSGSGASSGLADAKTVAVGVGELELADVFVPLRLLRLEAELRRDAVEVVDPQVEERVRPCITGMLRQE